MIQCITDGLNSIADSRIEILSVDSLSLKNDMETHWFAIKLVE